MKDAQYLSTASLNKSLKKILSVFILLFNFKMKKKCILITFDLEEFVTPSEVGMGIDKEELFNISLEGFHNLIRVLNKHNRIKATFFTTVEFAERARKELRKLINEGHEIALHGLYHNTNISQMTNEDAKKELLTAKKKLEKMFNLKVNGYRSPQMRILNSKILKDIGINYNSSMHPTYIPGRGNYFFEKRNVYFDNVLQVPVSVTPIIRLPFSWIWFRNMGLLYSKLCTRITFIDMDFVNIYFHPWDFVNLDIKPFNEKIMKLIIRRTGRKMIEEFDKYLNWSEKNFNSLTIWEYLNGRKKSF